MQIFQIVLGVLVNFIIYLSFGSLLMRKKGEAADLGLSVLIGFFSYYSLFFFVCIPVMKFYRPLSLLTAIWVPIVAVIVPRSSTCAHGLTASGVCSRGSDGIPCWFC